MHWVRGERHQTCTRYYSGSCSQNCTGSTRTNCKSCIPRSWPRSLQHEPAKVTEALDSDINMMTNQHHHLIIMRTDSVRSMNCISGRPNLTHAAVPPRQRKASALENTRARNNKGVEARNLAGR